MKVQISHRTPEDGAFAARLVAALRLPGIEPRADNIHAPCYGHPDLQACVARELRKYDFVVAVLSSAYLKDEWLQTELFECQLYERVLGKTFLLPVVVDDCEVPVLLRDRVIDFRAGAFEANVSRLAELVNEKPLVFVVMKFGDANLDSAYELAMKPVAQASGYDVVRVDALTGSESVTDQILAYIQRSSIVIADLTDERPNCYFEAGYALALGKEVILTIRKGSRIHFDLVNRRFIMWETDNSLKKELSSWFETLRLRTGASTR